MVLSYFEDQVPWWDASQRLIQSQIMWIFIASFRHNITSANNLANITFSSWHRRRIFHMLSFLYLLGCRKNVLSLFFYILIFKNGRVALCSKLLILNLQKAMLYVVFSKKLWSSSVGKSYLTLGVSGDCPWFSFALLPCIASSDSLPLWVIKARW